MNTRPIQFITVSLLFLVSVTAFSTVIRASVQAFFTALNQFNSVLSSHSYQLTLLQSQVSGRGWLNRVTVTLFSFRLKPFSGWGLVSFVRVLSRANPHHRVTPPPWLLRNHLLTRGLSFSLLSKLIRFTGDCCAAIVFNVPRFSHYFRLIQI